MARAMPGPSIETRKYFDRPILRGRPGAKSWGPKIPIIYARL